MTEQIQSLRCRLECFSRDLKVFWIGVFSAFRRKPSLGAPETTMVVMVVIIIIIQGDQDDHIQTPLMRSGTIRTTDTIAIVCIKLS